MAESLLFFVYSRGSPVPSALPVPVVEGSTTLVLVCVEVDLILRVVVSSPEEALGETEIFPVPLGEAEIFPVPLGDVEFLPGPMGEVEFVPESTGEVELYPPGPLGG